MSARLFAVLIVSSLIAAPALPAQQAAPPCKTCKEGNCGKAKPVSKVYQVTDLIVPIADAKPEPAQANAKTCTARITCDAASPIAAFCMANGKPCPKTTHAPGETLETHLVQLIQWTISPTSWKATGGHCTIEYFPLSQALVITAPPDVQEQVADLLAAVRRMQQQEIALELRFLTVADTVFDQLKAGGLLKDCKDGPMASLDDKQLFLLMEAAQADRRTQVMQAPKTTLFNGQLGALRLQDSKTFVTGINLRWSEQGIITQPTNEVIPLGFRIGMQPTISADRRYVELGLSIERSCLVSEAVPLVPAIFLSKVDASTGQRVGYLRTFPATNAKELAVPHDKEVENTKENEKGVLFTSFLQAPKVETMAWRSKLALPEGKTAVLYGWKQTAQVTEEVPVLSKLPCIGKLYKHARQEPETVLVMVTPRIVISEQVEERLPMPKPLQAHKSVKKVGGTEEQEPPSVAELLAKYHKACAAGRLKQAKKLAIKALSIDPTCFDTKR